MLFSSSSGNIYAKALEVDSEDNAIKIKVSRKSDGVDDNETKRGNVENKYNKGSEYNVIRTFKQESIESFQDDVRALDSS